MKARPRLKGYRATKNQRCPKCLKLLRRRITRCPTCATQQPKRGAV